MLSRRAFAGVSVLALAFMLIGLTLMALVLGSGRWMTLPRTLPVLGWVVLLTGSLALMFLRLRSRHKALTTAAVATAIEIEQKLRRGSLLGALEVGGSGALGAFAASKVASSLNADPLVPGARKRLSKDAVVGSLLLVAGLLLLFGASVLSPDGLAAVKHPVRAWDGTLLSALSFDELPHSVPRGMPVVVHMSAHGRRQVTVSRRSQGEAWRDTTLEVPESGTLSLALGPVTAPVQLRLTDGRSPAVAAELAVEARGWIGNIALKMRYPAYLHLSEETLEAIPPLRVPRGTKVEVHATLEGGARDAYLWNGKDTVAFVTGSNASDGSAGSVAVAVLTVDAESQWNWSAAATPRADGAVLPPELPDPLVFAVIADEGPSIAIISPAIDTAIGSTGTLAVVVQAADDHGVERVHLQVWREAANGEGKVVRETIPVAEPDFPVFLGGTTIVLDGRELGPGDKLHVTAIAVDNSPWNQTTQSGELVLRVPSLAEQRLMARTLADSLADRARQLAQSERNLQQNTTDASRNRELRGDENAQGKSNSTKNNRNLSFNTAERTRQLARDQQQLGARVDSLRQSARDLESRLKSANALDTALAQQMRDIQRMLKEAMTPEMQRQLEDLNRNVDRLSGTQVQQSMQQLAEQQRQMREQLERSAEMLKRAALEGAMQTLQDDARELSDAQKRVASSLDSLSQQKQNSSESSALNSNKALSQDSRTLADRTRDISKEIEALAKRLQEAGARDGATKTREAQPLANKSSEAMQRAAQALAQQLAEQQKQQQTQQQVEQQGRQQAQQSQQTQQAQQSQQAQSERQGQAGAQVGQPGQQNAGRQGSTGDTPGGSGGKAADEARRAADSMEQAAGQLASARESTVSAWKEQLSDQLDQSISETTQLARQQAELEQRMRQAGAQGAQNLQGEQSALQQGVQQTAERLEQTGRSSSLLSQRSQKAMGEAQRRVQQATQAMQQAGQPGSGEQAQSAMKDASEALNQALSSLIRDRERVNNAQSASGFSEMMQQLKDLAQQQGRLNSQMQGLNLMPGGAGGEQAQQQARILSRQQREVAQDLADVADNDQTGRMDALAKEAQTLAQQLERSGLDASVAARQQQLYRRLLDAGKFMEQDERDDQGPREARAASGNGSTGRVEGSASGRPANKFNAPTWDELRGLGPDERRIVIEYFKRLNSGGPPL